MVMLLRRLAEARDAGRSQVAVPSRRTVDALDSQRPACPSLINSRFNQCGVCTLAAHNCAQARPRWLRLLPLALRHFPLRRSMTLAPPHRRHLLYPSQPLRTSLQLSARRREQRRTRSSSTGLRAMLRTLSTGRASPKSLKPFRQAHTATPGPCLTPQLTSAT